MKTELPVYEVQELTEEQARQLIGFAYQFDTTGTQAPYTREHHSNKKLCVEPTPRDMTLIKTLSA